MFQYSAFKYSRTFQPNGTNSAIQSQPNQLEPLDSEVILTTRLEFDEDINPFILIEMR